MPRLPKDPDARQRRNKASTAASLATDSAELRKLKVPPLNSKVLGIKGAVKPQVQRWWREAWRSPMAPRWLTTDVEVLYVCAQLRQQIQVNLLNDKPIANLAAELRQQEGRLGLDVMSRRRLDWRIEGPKPSEPVKAPPVPAVKAEAPEADPRRVLRAL